MSDTETKRDLPAGVKRYARYLLIMAGLGGLIYGIDVGVIAAALPYIRNTSNYSSMQLGFIVGAVLWGSVISSLFAGSLAEFFGRKKIIIASAFCFFISIPVICLSGLFEGGNFVLLTVGRTLQGASAGLVGVVIPMYLAECLDSDSRGKGTGMFQLLLTIGLAFAAVIGLVVTGWVGDSDKVVKGLASEHGVEVAKVTYAQITEWAKPEQLKGWAMAWQTIFLCSAVPGLILFLGAFGLKESPRWLYKKGRKEEALASLAANNGEAKAKEILDEMIAADKAEAEEKAAIAKASAGDSLFQRKYIYPFCLAVVILACNQATGINSVLNYTVDIFKATGMEGVFANFSDLAIKLVNVFMTVVACTLVDKKGRKFLLKLGTGGVIIGLCGVATTFLLITKGVFAASLATGIVATVFFFMFIAFYAVGPGVCVWLALSELMPTRIRATGMSIAMIINQGVSATIATVFPAWKDAWGFPAVFYCLAGFTVIYFVTAAFFLPETKGKTLEEIERYFSKK
ncbi:MAG: sugar porter family MFS transporter [Kiritimatiellae bacterium]|nr:sugar porter family MFS transporter [Kiritimatiellia bacterium]